MIQNIKFGIKIASKNFDFLPEIYNNHEMIDFIEIILLPEFTSWDIEVIKNLKLPYAIHIPNSNYGIDFGNINSSYENLVYINKINEYKDVLTPICFIIHPESRDIEFSIKNIKKLKIKPLALENMPVKGFHDEELLGHDINSLKQFFEEIQNLEFCFDINHAIKAAISLKRDYIMFIKDFLIFKKPILFHISGGNLNIEIDEHLALDKSQYNLFEIKKLLLNYGNVVNLTFETPRNYENRIDDDLLNMKLFKNI